MNYFLVILLYGVIFYFINYIFLRNKLLIDKIHSSPHKSFLNKKNVPLTGGIFFLIIFIFYLKEFDLLEKIFICIIFLIGISSDINKLRSPILRLALQTLSIFLVIQITEIYVLNTRLDYLDFLLNEYPLLSLAFTIFCLLVFVNGSNFIDGVNCLASGYFLTIILILITHLNNIESSELTILSYDLKIISIFLFVFIIFNIFSKSFLGDSGSYFISLTVGLFCIKISFILQNTMSPFFIALLFWYPAFENLFSILRRKFYQGKNVKYADNLHLHHLLFNVLKQKIDKKFSNPLTGILISLVNFIFLIIGLNYLNNSLILIFLIIMKSIIYLSLYIFLRKKN